MNKLVQIYESLFELSKQIHELLERGLYSDLITYLVKKESLLNDAAVLIDNIKEQGAVDVSMIQDIAQKYASQEKINLEIMSKLKNEIKTELSQTNKNKKLLNAYSDDKEYIRGGILDFWE